MLDFQKLEILTAHILPMVSERHQTKFHADRSCHCRYMAVFRFFKMAADRYLGFLKFRNFNCRTLWSVNVRCRATFRADRSSRCQDRTVHSIFKMAAVRHLGFSKVGNFNCPYGLGPVCVTMPNFTAIG